MPKLLGQVFEDGGDGYIGHGADGKCSNERVAVVAVLRKVVCTRRMKKATGNTLPEGNSG